MGYGHFSQARQKAHKFHVKPQKHVISSDKALFLFKMFFVSKSTMVLEYVLEYEFSPCKNMPTENIVFYLRQRCEKMV